LGAGNDSRDGKIKIDALLPRGKEMGNPQLSFYLFRSASSSTRRWLAQA